MEPFPATGEKHQAPKTGVDFHPVWAPDGRSLYYIAAAARPTMSVPITTQPSVRFGAPVEVPRAPQPRVVSFGVRGYDLLPDGCFVAVVPVEGADAPRNNELRGVLNWTEELKRLAPIQ